MVSIKESVSGHPFRDVLGLLMAHAFGGAEEEADPHVLSLLDREYIAWAIALYYQCAHCQAHHHKNIVALRRKASEPEWPWEQAVVETVVFSRVELSAISEKEQGEWKRQWSRFTRSLGPEHARVVTLTIFAIAVARDDKELIRFVFETLVHLCGNAPSMHAIVRDVFRVTIAMKASTTMFRVESVVMELLAHLPEHR